jgi:hypothetical protein
MSAFAVELGLLDVFGSLVPSFPQRFWASNSLRTLKISSSAVELVFKDDFGKSRDSVSVDCFEPVLVFVC